MWESETLDLRELGEHEGFDYESSWEFDPFGDGEDGESWESGSDLFDYEALGEASLDTLEADPFLGDLLRTATQTLSRASGGAINDQFLKNVAKQAAQVAGGAIAGPQGARIASQIANNVIREGDYEGSYENGSYESMLESSGVDMEAVADLHYFANRMAEAESEAEADEFLGALLPILGQVAAPLISNLVKGNRESDGFGDSFDEESWGNEESRDEFLPALLPFVPMIAKGVGAVGKLLTRKRKTKRLCETTPQIAYEAVYELARNRYPMTRNGVASAVSSATARTLGNRQRAMRAMRQNQTMTRRAIPGRPPQNARYGNNGSSGYGSGGMYQSRATSQSRGRTTTGSTRGRPRLIGYVPVYGKR